jgi:hypothetical protein
MVRLMPRRAAGWNRRCCRRQTHGCVWLGFIGPEYAESSPLREHDVFGTSEFFYGPANNLTFCFVLRKANNLTIVCTKTKP